MSRTCASPASTRRACAPPALKGDTTSPFPLAPSGSLRESGSRGTGLAASLPLGCDVRGRRSDGIYSTTGGTHWWYALVIRLVLGLARGVRHLKPSGEWAPRGFGSPITYARAWEPWYTTCWDNARKHSRFSTTSRAAERPAETRSTSPAFSTPLPCSPRDRLSHALAPESRGRAGPSRRVGARSARRTRREQIEL